MGISECRTERVCRKLTVTNFEWEVTCRLLQDVTCTGNLAPNDKLTD